MLRLWSWWELQYQHADPRRLGEMTKLISDEIAGKAATGTSTTAEKQRTASGKMSRKERMKQELKQRLNDDMGAVFQQMESARDNTEARLVVVVGSFEVVFFRILHSRLLKQWSLNPVQEHQEQNGYIHTYT